MNYFDAFDVDCAATKTNVNLLHGCDAQNLCINSQFPKNCLQTSPFLMFKVFLFST